MTAIRTREGAALGYPGAKISLKEDDVPSLFPVVEATLVTLLAEHNGHSDFGPNDCVASTCSLMHIFLLIKHSIFLSFVN